VTIDAVPQLSAQLFVYGTLKRGQARAHYLCDQSFLGPATTCPRYRLLNCGDYPGLVHWQPGVAIQGELWQVTEQCLQILDQVEGVPSNLYQRGEVALQEPWQAGPVLTYFYQRDATGLPSCGTCW